MASITIRRLGDETMQRLRVRAAQHGRSLEDEAREIIRGVLCAEQGELGDLSKSIRARFEPLGGVELEVPERQSTRSTLDELG